MIYFTSDLHIYHDREFIWKERGFDSVEDMNKTIIDNINSVVREKDTLYILGDLMLNKSKQEEAMSLLRSINCQDIHIIAGSYVRDLEGIVRDPVIEGIDALGLFDLLAYGRGDREDYYLI